MQDIFTAVDVHQISEVTLLRMAFTKTHYGVSLFIVVLSIQKDAILIQYSLEENRYIDQELRGKNTAD